MAESRDTEPQGAAAEPLPERVVAQLTEIAALLSLSAEQYQQQAQLVRQTASAEMALSRRSLVLAVALMVAVGAGAVMLWGSVLIFVGYWLFQLTASVPLTAGLLIAFQLLAIYWCMRNLRYILKQVGFSQTMGQLKGLFRFTAEPAGGIDVNRSVD